VALVSDCEVTYDIRYRIRGVPSSIDINSVSEIKWARRCDDISKANITHVITTDNLDGVTFQNCCEQLGRLEPWADSVEIREDGELVWAGPITGVEYNGAVVTVECQDNLVWSRVRALTADYEKTQDSALHFLDLWNNALANDPRPVQILTSLTGVIEARKYTLSYNRMLFFLLKEMWESSIDVVALGQNIHVGALALGSPLSLTNEDFAGDLVLRKAGELYAGQVLVEGARSVAARYPTGKVNGEGIYPLVQDIVYDENLQSNVSAEAVARSRWDFSSGRVPRIVRAGDALELRQGAIKTNKLLPTTIVNLNVTSLCYSQREKFRLGNVDVVFTGGIKTTTISLQPIGTAAQLETVSQDDDRGAEATA
jgi:hypothetical protein